MSFPKQKDDPKHALVLAGGGALGAYEVGVLEALCEGRWQGGRHGPIRASLFTGTSVGAFNATVMSSSFDTSDLDSARYLRGLWLQRIADPLRGPKQGILRSRRVMPFRRRSHSHRRLAFDLGLNELGQDVWALTRNWLRRALSLGFDNEPSLRRFARLFDPNDVVSCSPLKCLIEETIDPKRVLDPRARPLRLVTTQWDNGRTVIFDNKEYLRIPPWAKGLERRCLALGNVRSVVRASTALPGLVSPVSISGKLFADGSAMSNAPLTPAIVPGISTMHVIHMEPELTPIPFGRAPSAFESLERLLVSIPTSMLETELHRASLIRQLAVMAKDLHRIRGLGLRGGSSPTATGRRPALTDSTRNLIKDLANKHPPIVHRYFPTRSVGGALGLLDFRQESIKRLIELGFHDTVYHDCEINGCLV